MESRSEFMERTCDDENDTSTDATCIAAEMGACCCDAASDDDGTAVDDVEDVDVGVCLASVS